jgi:hypothetical protein
MPHTARQCGPLRTLTRIATKHEFRLTLTCRSCRILYSRSSRRPRTRRMKACTRRAVAQLGLVASRKFWKNCPRNWKSRDALPGYAAASMAIAVSEVGTQFGVYLGSTSFGLLQLRVLRLGFLQDGNVGVGVFPEGEKSLDSLRFYGSPTLRTSSANRGSECKGSSWKSVFKLSRLKSRS